MSKPFETIALSSEEAGEILVIGVPLGDSKGYKEMQITAQDGETYTVTDKNLEEFAIKVLSALGYIIRPM